jgi:hypothetical protein
MQKATESSRPPPPPSPEAIARRAYELFERRGRVPGHELEDWLVAEAELTGTAVQAATDEPQPAAGARRPARAQVQPKRRPAERNSTP